MTTPNENGFDYSALDPETCKIVQACTREIQTRLLTTVEQMIEIGQQLQIAKQRLRHGQFQSWLLTEFNMNPRQARRIMLVTKHFKTDKYAVLKFAPSALYLLAEMKTPNAARQEALSRAKQEEHISWSTAKEIVTRHKSIAGQDPTPDDNSNPVTPHQTKAKKRAEPLETSVPHQFKRAESAVLDTDNEQRAEHVTIDIPAITIPDESILSSSRINLVQTASLQFSVGDRVRILCRQEGKDKWTGCTAQVWEVTQNGWLRVNVEGHQGVKFTLKPEWVELIEELNMTEPTNAQTFSDPDPVIPEKPVPVRIPLEIEGQTIEIDGIINEVEVHYTHKGIAGTIMLPANRVIFSEA